MGVIVSSERLRLEMALRGWDATRLARAARLSPATVSTALSGRPISATSMNLIAKALTETPVNVVIDRLLKSDGSDLGFA